ncbi:MAG: hypothetical protein KY397_01085 [Gemmatimonadetes bacterium]|nr:hypothetical protein [Gemmatimonadota bacterium]
MRGGVAGPFPPPGYSRWRQDTHRAVAWEPAAEALRRALGAADSLHAWAAERSQRTVETGRGTLHVATLGPTRAAVRHYRRGGWMGPLLGDRYLDRPPRPFAELAVSEALRAAGVATPRVVAAVATDAAPGYRADLATEWLEGGEDLLALLRSGSCPPEARAAALGAAGGLVGRAHAAGLDHPDLNLANLFVRHDGEAWRAALLDLDRARLAPDDPSRGERNLARFRRSVAKAVRDGRIAWTEADEAAFRAGWSGGRRES